MRYPVRFSQALLAAYNRAIARYRDATGQTLSLEEIARDVNIDPRTLIGLLHGEKTPNITYLLPLLVYLGCDEEEQRILFHLAEIASPYDIEQANEVAAMVFSLPMDTEPIIERITEKRASHR